MDLSANVAADPDEVAEIHVIASFAVQAAINKSGRVAASSPRQSGTAIYATLGMPFGAAAQFNTVNA